MIILLISLQLPSAAPIKEHLKDDYFTYIAPLKQQLDDIPGSYLETEVASNLPTH